MEELRAEIERCLVERRYDRLGELCESGIEREPDNLDYYWYLGLAHALGGNIELAGTIWLPALLESDGSELARILKTEVLRQLEGGEFLTARIIYGQLRELTGESDRDIEEGANRYIDFYLKGAGEEEDFFNLLSWNDKNPDIWHDLGVFYYKNQQYSKAFQSVNKAIEIDDRKAIYHYTIGTILEKQVNFLLAIDAYNNTIALDNNYIEAYNNLGIIYYNSGQLQKAKEHFLQSIFIDSDYYRGHINLGNVYLIEQDWDRARYHYEKARELAGESENILQNLTILDKLSSEPLQADLYSGDYYYDRERSEAIEYYKKALQYTEKQTLGFYLRLADAYKYEKNYLKALEICDRGLKIYPLEMEIHRKKVIFLEETQKIEEAIDAINKALELLPDSLTLKLESMRLMPIVYEKQEDIEVYRNRYTEHLNEIIENLNLETEQQRTEAETAIKVRTNFYLQYQGKNDLELQNKYGELVYKILALNHPDLVLPLSLPDRENEKIRVGYISSHLRHHTVGKLYQGWIKHRDREKFEVYSYAIDVEAISDIFKKYYREDSDRFYQFDKNFTLEQIAKQILEDRLELLVYLDIGMDPRTTTLAGLRLAPIQCVTWGHPITSGLPTIDYFLSSDLMEPEGGESHYREKLIRLPNLSISYPKPPLPNEPKTRGEFGLKDDAVVYLSCQTLFKYLPENDDIFPRIALEVPNSQFAFIRHRSPFVTESFIGRLKKAFARYGLNWEEYGVMLDHLVQFDYFHVNLLSDVYLDNISWSGGNTTLEAIACNLPIVTCPGSFMRGRHTYAILKLLGVEETIGASKEEYINIAIRLGKDREWREKVKERMRERESRVFEERTCIEGLENFYRSVIEQRG